MTELKQENNFWRISMKKIASILFLSFFLASCTTPHYVDKNLEDVADRINRVDYSLKPKIPPRPEELGYVNLLKRKAQVLGDSYKGYDENSIVGKALAKKLAFVRAYSNTELFSFLSLLFSDSGVLIKYGPNVNLNAPVTLDLKKQRTVKEALEGALAVLDYKYKILDDKTIEIVAQETLEVYLRMPNSQFQYQVKITNGSLKTDAGSSEAVPSGTTIDFTTTSTDTEAKGSSGGGSSGAVVSFWKDLTKTLESLVSEQGKVSVGASTGSVIITDTPSRITRIAEFLQKTADDLSKQAIIQVNVMEIAFAETNSKGIQWDQVMNRLSKSSIGKLSYTPTNFLDPSGNAIEFTLLNSKDNYKMLIQALRDQGKLSVISKPKVLALNHQPVIIQGGQFISYVKKLETTSQTTSGAVNYSADPGSILDGLTLFIHPSISDHEVTLNLTPVVSRLVEMKKVSFGDPKGNMLEMDLPTMSVQTMNTSARVGDGEVLVIGGLLSDSKQNRGSGLPWINRVPGIGKLFEWTVDSTSEDLKRREIVITLQPKILPEPVATLEMRRI